MRFIRPITIRNYFSRQPLLPKGRLISGQDPTRQPTVLYGMGDLGDDLAGMAAVPDFVSRLKSLIISHAGPTYAGGLTTNLSLPAILYAASNCYERAGSGGLGAQAQQYWNAWKAQAEPATSNDNIYWVFARCISRWAPQLIAAATDQINSGMLYDAAASKATYTLVDTTQQGTTWMGGTVSSSKLDNPQWGATFEVAFNAIAKGIAGGSLPFTYLDVLVKGFCNSPIERKLPIWHPPYAGATATDPRAVAFRALMKQLGWSNVVKLWYGYTMQAWADQNEAAEAQDAMYQKAITVLNYTSGKAIYDQIAAKVQEYFAARAEAVAAINQFKQMQTGPLAANIPAADIAAMEAIRKQFSSTDTSINTTLAPLGLWPSVTPVGLSFIGISTLIVGGVIAVAALGMVVWGITIMTETTRTAAAQTKATADKILSVVEGVKSSCERVYAASKKTPADEKAYQDCLLKTQELVKLIPEPPSGSDPLGLKWIAIVGMVAIGGLFAWKATKK